VGPLLLSLALTFAAVGSRGAVATAHPAASQAAAEVLRRGGNAADAAVAAALVLSVVDNASSGIGGGGFALVWTEKERRVRVLDFREVAPAAARPDMFLRDGRPVPGASREGGLAVAVPGAVQGYAALAARFGRLPLRQLVEPAAQVAEAGFRVGRKQEAFGAEKLACLRADAAAAHEFLVPGPDGPAAPAAGTLLRRNDLARTLRRLGRDPKAFYRGPLAARIAAAVRARGGVLSEADLAGYRVREREPLWGGYRGWRIASMPPPSAGGAILIGLLQALEGEDPGAGGFRPERFLHAFAEIEKRLFARRAGLLGDPDFAPSALPAARDMADPALARALRAMVGERATPSSAIPMISPGDPRSEGHTSHLSVVDGEGNAVSMTTTVNTPFGACLVVPGTGILLNDQMDDFDVAPGLANAYGLIGGGANAVAPGKVPLSSMAPTLVFDAEGRLRLAVGSPGGSTIPSTVAQVIVHLLDDQMPLDQALGVPRIHHQWMPDEILVEPWGLDAATAEGLRARGHLLRFRKSPFGDPQAVWVDPAARRFEAASEPRGEGAPAAP